MYLKQFYLQCLAHASYLIADEKTGTAVVVDPQRDVDVYIEEAERLGFRIEHVFLTHFHADFLAGHLELRDRVGARIHLSEHATAEYPFIPAREGEALTLGDVRLVFLSTPGHTNSALSLVVHDLAQDPSTPHAVLTGDTLFVGDVGRPDLLASVGVSARELGSMLYDSLHEKLMKLPDETLVYPAHGAGSLCGKSLGTETVTTIGAQKQLNYALQPMTKDQFIDLVAADQPDAPPYFAFDVALNRAERPTLDGVLERELTPLSPEMVASMQAEVNAQVLDARAPDAFAVGHLAGSLNITLEGRFATWSGFLVDHERPVVLVTDPGREREAALRLGRIGYDIVAGYLDHSAVDLDQESVLVERTQRVSPAELATMLESPEAPLLIDVRTEDEWKAGHITGSVNIPLNRLPKRLAEVPRDRKLAVICQTGERSSSAASLIQRSGIDDLVDVEGGLEAWSGLALESTTS